MFYFDCFTEKFHMCNYSILYNNNNELHTIVIVDRRNNLSNSPSSPVPHHLCSASPSPSPQLWPCWASWRACHASYSCAPDTDVSEDNRLPAAKARATRQPLSRTVPGRCRRTILDLWLRWSPWQATRSKCRARMGAGPSTWCNRRGGCRDFRSRSIDLVPRVRSTSLYRWTTPSAGRTSTYIRIHEASSRDVSVSDHQTNN